MQSTHDNNLMLHFNQTLTLVFRKVFTAENSQENRNIEILHEEYCHGGGGLCLIIVENNGVPVLT